MSKRNDRRQLERQHARDPRCRLCGAATRLLPQQAGGRHPEDAAVMCRWHPRDDPKNELPPGKPRRRLTCWACANRRHHAFDAERPIEELWWRSGRFPSEVYYVQK